MSTPSLQLASRTLFLSTGLLLLFGVAVLGLDALPDPVFNRQGPGQMAARRPHPVDTNAANIAARATKPSSTRAAGPASRGSEAETDAAAPTDSLAGNPRSIQGPQLRFENIPEENVEELATPFDQPRFVTRPKSDVPQVATRPRAPDHHADQDALENDPTLAAPSSPRANAGPRRVPLPAPSPSSPNIAERPVPRWEVLDLPPQDNAPGSAPDRTPNPMQGQLPSAGKAVPHTAARGATRGPGAEAPRRRVFFVELDKPHSSTPTAPTPRAESESPRQENRGKVLARTARRSSDPALSNDALPWRENSPNGKPPREKLPNRDQLLSNDDDLRDEEHPLTGRAERAPRTSDVEQRLGQMQSRLDQLAQAQTQRQSLDLDRALQTLQQIQNSTRLQEMERQLQDFQRSRSGVAAPPPANAPGAAVVDEATPGRAVPPAPARSQALDPARTGGNTRLPATDGEKIGPPMGEALPLGTDGGGKSVGDRKPILTARPTQGSRERFSLQIQNADITQVLEMLGQMSDLNILVTKDVRGLVSLNLQDVTVEQALNAILRSRGFVFEREDKFLFVSTAVEAEARKKQSRKMVTKVYRPHYISVRDLQALVTPILTPIVGKVAVTLPNEAGLQTDATNAGGDRMSQADALLVQDYAEVQDEVEKVLREMDVPPLQVVIEAMILSVKLNDEMQFGVNFALLSGGNRNLVVSGNGNTLNGSAGFPGVKDNTILPPAAQFLADTAGLKYGLIRGDISAFINALETITDTNLIASPQLRVINKQRAQLIIGDRLSYSTSVFQNNQAIQNVNFVDAGTKLVIRPYISNDGMVRMEIHPERSTATINRTTNLPDIQTTEVTTNVMVRDGTTVVIGGLIEEQAVQTVNRIPVLGSLPVVGAAFRSKSDDVRRTEMIVLITPRIIRDPEAELEGNIARDEGERRAEHFRENMSSINRKSLTRIHFERALNLYEQGNLERAQVHILEALRQNKNDIAALRLRDQIAKAISERNREWVRFPGSPTKRATQPRSNYSGAPIATPAAATPGAIPLPTEPGPGELVSEPQPDFEMPPSTNAPQNDGAMQPQQQSPTAGSGPQLQPGTPFQIEPVPPRQPAPVQPPANGPGNVPHPPQPQLQSQPQFRSTPQPQRPPQQQQQQQQQQGARRQTSPFLRSPTGPVRPVAADDSPPNSPNPASSTPKPLSELPRISW